MNRLPPDGRKDTIGAVSAHCVRLPKGQPNPHVLNLGDCPIVVESHETARKAAQWAYDQAFKQLTDHGVSEDAARKAAGEVKTKQLAEMLETCQTEQDGGEITLEDAQAIIDNLDFNELLDLRHKHEKIGDDLRTAFSAAYEELNKFGLKPTEQAKLMLYNAIVSLSAAQGVEKELGL